MRIELAGICDFHIGLAALLVADHPDRRGVLDVKTHAQVLVGPHPAASLPSGSTTKGNPILCSAANFSANPCRFSGDFQSGVRTRCRGTRFRSLGMRVEVARQHRSLKRPVMHGQREIVLYQGNLVGARPGPPAARPGRNADIAGPQKPPARPASLSADAAPPAHPRATTGGKHKREQLIAKSERMKTFVESS